MLTLETLAAGRPPATSPDDRAPRRSTAPVRPTSPRCGSRRSSSIGATGDLLDHRDQLVHRALPTTGDVDDEPGLDVGSTGEQVGPNHITDVGEVAELITGTEQRERRAVERRLRTDGA